MRSALLTVMLLFSSAPIADEAPLYQWQDPESGRTQMSGRAPGWYRGLQEGPRVLVFRDGVLVDDTAVAVSDELRAQLRAEALTAAARDAAPLVAEQAPASDAPAEREVVDKDDPDPTDEALAGTLPAEGELSGDMRARMLETLGKLDAFFLESAAKALQSSQGLPGVNPASDEAEP